MTHDAKHLMERMLEIMDSDNGGCGDIEPLSDGSRPLIGGGHTSGTHGSRPEGPMSRVTDGEFDPNSSANMFGPGGTMMPGKLDPSTVKDNPAAGWTPGPAAGGQIPDGTRDGPTKTDTTTTPIFTAPVNIKLTPTPAAPKPAPAPKPPTPHRPASPQPSSPGTGGRKPRKHPSQQLMEK